MTIVVTRSGKGSALSAGENDGNLDSVCGINEAQAATSYTVVAADQNRTIECSNASPIAVALDAIATIAAAVDTSDFTVTIKNIGAGATTITPNVANTIDDGSSTIVLAQWEYVTLQTDSTLDIWNIINTNVDIATNTTNIATNAAKIAGLNTKILEIGTWDMDADAQATAVAHGVTLSKIRSMKVTIREDADLHFYDFAAFDNDSGSTSSFIRVDATNINMQRASGGAFDNTSFNTVGGDGNRGWIVIQYTD